MTTTANLEMDTGASCESLEQRLGAGGLSFLDVLQVATDLASELRELHAYRVEYGVLCARTVVMDAHGATLAPLNGQAHRGDGRGDLSAFGVLLNQMLNVAEPPPHLLEAWGEAAAIALRCVTHALEMQQAVIAMRLLTLRSRLTPELPVVEPTLLEHFVAGLKSLASLIARALTTRHHPDPVVKST
jgi:hypothetical protein